jgi:hypothetical protein
MALEKEIWIKDIQERITETVEFLQYTTDHSEYIKYKSVHVPQAGNIMSVEVNRNSFPAPLKRRTDDELIYKTNQYTTDPVHIPSIEVFQINYDKRMSMYKEGYDFMAEVLAMDALYAYAKDSATIRTTGSSSDFALAKGATGNRKAITLVDVRKAAQILDKQGVPSTDRYLALPSDMYHELLAVEAVQNNAFNGYLLAMKDGQVPEIAGFKILKRNNLVTTDGAGVALAYDKDYAGTATDNVAAIAWHPSFVAKAMGATNVYFKEQDPQLFGDAISFEQWAGFSKLRKDNKGVVVIAQDAVV